MIELNIPELKSIISKSISCKIRDSVILESRYGSVTFNLFGTKATVTLKRLSGNGKILINQKETIVKSKSLFSTDAYIEDGKLTICRPNDGIGEVVVLGIKVYMDEFEEEILSSKWKSVLDRVEYECLSLIGGKLKASQGAYITNESSVCIETNPPNAYIRTDGKIKFQIACEITELSIDKNLPMVNKSKNLFVPRVAPDVIITPQQSKQVVVEQVKNFSTRQKQRSEHIMNLILFDSKISREFTTQSPNSKTLKYIKSNNVDYLLIKSGGAYKISVPYFKPNMEYVAVINAKKLNGNGRLTIDTSYGFSASVNISNVMSEHYVSIKSGNVILENDKMTISMSDDASGEVIIERIQIIEGIHFNGKFLVENKDQQPILNFSSKKQILPDRKFVIVIPSYKNSTWCERNIQSVIDQNYKKFRCIFVDDCSPDDTFEKVKNAVESSDKKHLFTVTRNSVRKGALHNLHDMIHSCDDDEIIITLDGDDWLAHDKVLSYLNDVYTKNDVWMTYGQYRNHPDGGTGISVQIPDTIINSNGFRKHPWCSSHLRSFYSWLFKKIEIKDMMYEGKFFSMTWDFIIMFPQLEMAGHRAKFISEILYVYNLENPMNDHKVDQKLQHKLDRHIRNMPKYKRLEKAPKFKSDNVQVGLMVIATGKYDQFVQGIISSADNYFLREDNIDVTYYVFSDKELQINTNRNVEQIRIDHRPFPFASMDRFAHFTNNVDKLITQDYVYYADVDSLFVDNIRSSEIFGNLVGVTHCGFVNMQGPVENNVRSVLYTNPELYKTYYGGGFSGGKTESYLALSKWCKEAIETDLANGIIPRVHDESAINKFFLDNPPVTLTPEYHYPQSNAAHYKKIWGKNTYKPKILLLDKNHKEVRGE